MEFSLTTREQVRPLDTVDLGTLDVGEAAVGAVSGALYIKMPGDQAIRFTEDGFDRAVSAKGQHVLRVTSLRLSATHE